MGGDIPFTPPSIIGHEVAGIIERVGKSQQVSFKEGDRVIVGMRYKCGRCSYCEAGRENLCRNRPLPSSVKKKDGSPVHRWNIGGFSQYLALPGYVLFPVPDGLPLDESCIIGCRVTTAYNAVKHGAELEPGESSLVIGCGGVGLNTLQFLRCFGAHPIIAVDVLDEKLEAAKKFGATHTINATKEDPVEATKSITGGGVHKAFEAIGNTKTADQIVRSTKPGGTAVIIGGLPRGPLTFSDSTFPFNEIKVTGVALRRANDVRDVLQIVKDGRIDIHSFISKKYRLEQINNAVEDLEKGRILMGITLWN